MIARPFSLTLLGMLLSAGTAGAAVSVCRAARTPRRCASRCAGRPARGRRLLRPVRARGSGRSLYGRGHRDRAARARAVQRERVIEPDPWGGDYVEPERYEPYEDDRRLRREQRMRELGRYPGGRPDGFPEFREPPPIPPQPQMAAPQPQPSTPQMARELAAAKCSSPADRRRRAPAARQPGDGQRLRRRAGRPDAAGHGDRDRSGHATAVHLDAARLALPAPARTSPRSRSCCRASAPRRA